MSWHPAIPSRVTDAGGRDWLVRRAWPGPEGGDYVLEIRSPGIPGVRAAHLRHGIFEPVPEKDPRLPALAKEAPKGEVVAHRAHKRAVVHAGSRYIKVFRPGPAETAARNHTLATAPLTSGCITAPLLLESRRSVVVFSSIPGRSYYELGQDHATVTDASFARMWREWSLAWLQTVDVANSADFRSSVAGLPLHPPAAEVANLRRWIDLWLLQSEGVPEAAAARTGLVAQAENAITGLMATRPDPFRWAHGDLHDKQLLGRGGSGTPGLLDFDEACQAEPALDLANLAVNLELRLCQKLLTTRRYAIAHGEIMAVAEELHVAPERFAAYCACARLRMACLYSFRPPWGARATRYLVKPFPSPSPDREPVPVLSTDWSLT